MTVVKLQTTSARSAFTSIKLFLHNSEISYQLRPMLNWLEIDKASLFQTFTWFLLKIPLPFEIVLYEGVLAQLVEQWTLNP